ncbi:hypothetical protein [Aurantiacibacter gilvus]|uniref:Lipoprotein n=1 Tax=Aurantiacibacter gilvus TaxID=3139141 RepID=A0ABU9IGD6_9SPHN
MLPLRTDSGAAFSIPQKLLQICAAPCLALAVSGCWYSAEPLINAENGSAIPFEGSYADPDGGEEPIQISAFGAGVSYRVSQGDESQEIYFLLIEGSWYVAQITDPLEEPEVVALGPDLEGTRTPTNLSVYRIMHWSGEVLQIYEPECDEDLAKIPGIEVSDATCLIGGLDALALAASEFTTAIETGEATAEYDALRRLSE